MYVQGLMGHTFFFFFSGCTFPKVGQLVAVHYTGKTGILLKVVLKLFCIHYISVHDDVLIMTYMYCIYECVCS